MNATYHLFHIPVMGTGHSIDTPIRVAPFGISSVISIVDDLLVERIRKHYAQQEGLPYEQIPRYAENGRSRRITAYLDLVREIVHRRLEAIMLMALARDPRRRYATAGELGDDLDRYLAGQLPLAQPEPTVCRAGRWLLKRRLSVAVAVTLAGMLAGIAILGYLLNARRWLASDARPPAAGIAARRPGELASTGAGSPAGSSPATTNTAPV